MDWYSGSGYCLSTGSLFPGDELIGGTMKNYKKTIALHGESSFTKVCENADATASVLTEAVYVSTFF